MVGCLRSCLGRLRDQDWGLQALEGDLRELIQGRLLPSDGAGGTIRVSYGDPAFEGFLKSLLPGDSLRVEPLAPLLHQLRLIKGADELSLVRSGLDDTMRIAYHSMAEVWRSRDDVPDLRTAAYIVAITRVAATYQAKGH